MNPKRVCGKWSRQTCALLTCSTASWRDDTAPDATLGLLSLTDSHRRRRRSWQSPSCGFSGGEMHSTQARAAPHGQAHHENVMLLEVPYDFPNYFQPCTSVCVGSGGVCRRSRQAWTWQLPLSGPTPASTHPPCLGCLQTKQETWRRCCTGWLGECSWSAGAGRSSADARCRRRQ